MLRGCVVIRADWRDGIADPAPILARQDHRTPTFQEKNLGFLKQRGGHLDEKCL